MPAVSKRSFTASLGPSPAGSTSVMKMCSIALGAEGNRAGPDGLELRNSGIDAPPRLAHHWNVDFEVWPKDPVAAAALVALVMADILDRDDRDMEVLLFSF